MTRLAKVMSMFGLASASVLAAALTSGDVAPAFTAKNQDGKEVHLSDYRGSTRL